jgi:Protein of unknown function (DUF732)
MNKRGLLRLGSMAIAIGACGTHHSATGPAAYESAISGSTTGSGVSKLAPNAALQVGRGICSQFSRGQTVEQIVAGAYQQTDGRLPPEAQSELMTDATQFLCPAYYGEWKKFALSGG